MLACALSERLVGPLQNPLRTDVDPRASGHLSVHGEPHLFELAELFPGCPVRDEERVGDQDTRGVFVSLEHPDRATGLNEERLIVLQFFQGTEDKVKILPRSRRLPGPPVYDEVGRVSGNLGVEVVLDHPPRRLLQPPLAVKARPAWCPYRSCRRIAHLIASSPVKGSSSIPRGPTRLY